MGAVLGLCYGMAQIDTVLTASGSHFAKCERKARAYSSAPARVKYLRCQLPFTLVHVSKNLYSMLNFLRFGLACLVIRERATESAS
jgi:hypothetical protein